MAMVLAVYDLHMGQQILRKVLAMSHLSQLCTPIGIAILKL
ncbi:hypothetical protein SDC9_107346 [bioreactor metagenome]|jgi:hypothetical protein|uniref:Uncharacterized protein n=1 Tax=bioreactor metagenome TaxID=1076179 RepID=A0A645B4Y6_9ZZZZ